MSIRFTDPALYLKGTATAYLQDSDNNIVYASDKFQTANVTTSVTMGEIRGGIGNPVQMMIPTDSNVQVEFVAADFSLFAKAAQVGAVMSFGAPVMVCQTVDATGSALSIDVSGGAPVAAAGSPDVVCFVQEVGAPSPIATGGIAYPITSGGAISGFSAVSGRKYKVWYHISRANAQMATLNSLFDPSVYRFTAVMAVYSSAGGKGNTGTHVGNLTVIVPSLKLGGDGAGVNGNQTDNDTTSITGQALAFDELTIGEGCDECSGGGSPMAYYIYVPCDAISGIEGVVGQLGGVVSFQAGDTYQLSPKLVVNRQLVNVTDTTSGFTYTMGAGASATVNAAGLISGSTEEDTEVTVTYSVGGNSWSDVVNVSVEA